MEQTGTKKFALLIQVWMATVLYHPTGPPVNAAPLKDDDACFRKGFFWQEWLWFCAKTGKWALNIYVTRRHIIKRYMGTTGFEGKVNHSALSASDFRTSGQTRSLDYGGGDKSGLTDIGMWIAFPCLAPRPGEKVACVMYMRSNMFLFFAWWKGFKGLLHTHKTSWNSRHKTSQQRMKKKQLKSFKGRER